MDSTSSLSLIVSCHLIEIGSCKTILKKNTKDGKTGNSSCSGRYLNNWNSAIPVSFMCAISDKFSLVRSLFPQKASRNKVLRLTLASERKVTSVARHFFFGRGLNSQNVERGSSSLHFNSRPTQCHRWILKVTSKSPRILSGQPISSSRFLLPTWWMEPGLSVSGRFLTTEYLESFLTSLSISMLLWKWGLDPAKWAPGKWMRIFLSNSSLEQSL